MNYTCNLCKELGVETIMPADQYGAALMREHLNTEHHLSLGTYYASMVRGTYWNSQTALYEDEYEMPGDYNLDH